MSSSQSLYGIRRQKSEASKKDLVSSSTLAFTTHLSTLIAKESKASSPGAESASGSTISRGRARKSQRPDIFSVHNKGAKKRAAADLSSDNAALQIHKRGADIGEVDDAVLNRSKRKMLEKTKLYDELQKGEYLAEGDSDSDEAGQPDDRFSSIRRADKNSLVNFDKKWAESRASKIDTKDESDDETTFVEYEDEFGRTRTGTKAEAAEAQRNRQLQQERSNMDDGGVKRNMKPSRVPVAARPSRPSNVIYGSAIQAAAFNPDENITAQMSNLAKKRDKSLTPPPETHYNAEGEVRTRGTGFYAFSNDEEIRKKEMEELMASRSETTIERNQAAMKKEAREKAKQERRKKIEELRGKKRADKFLGSLDTLLPSGASSEEASGKAAD
ncbi:hypothetical protein H112_01962 [Trichophyton rubrum D6]|uniref:Uncharacterized protein n=4 Tax=Trichophyton TaxID=5550 RepID=A0A178F124_TRIRU|nr:uncharacterized protein TERG_06728 [Trichophyton rubrum CBS 118892]EZF25769.1 hypothetical protein H100_01958 [Trichophyton rubrum MR850]EZF44941.1 hypothetical protein H102_01957 [Trichophyton rubrum CBS 100081]EZF55433.1 hypothetical protein H103_01968 [Trichophyton rubrum CBS 288.86]EZF66174.1 hypothetical protein H104_01943 [Trichophyton rubrum CBS 289.86]EZF76794.1 hypothetical protein H105_01972 [Trichophyton soudanense CBS 452.61]EZF87342.1 hypothetical protein H110_01967 [Trichophy